MSDDDSYYSGEDSSDDDSPKHITCFFGKREPCAECEAAVAIQQEIYRTQYALAALRAKHVMALQNMNSVHDPLVSRLPVEVMSRIFANLVPVDVDKGYSIIPPHDAREITTTPRLLGAVCRTWRSVAWSTRELWSSISINVYFYFDGLADIIHEWLGKSGKLPLYIHLHASPERTEDIYGRCVPPAQGDEPFVAKLMDAINAYSERWFHLDFCIPKRFMQSLQAVGGQAKMLNTLKLQMVVQCIKRPDLEVSEIINLGKTPNLRNISLVGLNFNQVYINWENLRRLKVPSIRVDICLELFRTAPFLTHCTIGKVPNSYDYPILRHCNLTFLDVGEWVWQKKLLSSLDLPALQHLAAEIFSLDQVDVIQAFLQRSACSLKSFGLNLPYISKGNDAESIVQMVGVLMPLSLETLELDCEFSNSWNTSPKAPVDQESQHSGEKQQPFLPNLKNLRIIVRQHTWNCLLDLSCHPEHSTLTRDGLEGFGELAAAKHGKVSHTDTLQIQSSYMSYLLDLDIQRKLQHIVKNNFEVSPSEELKLPPSVIDFLGRSLYQYQYYLTPSNSDIDHHYHDSWSWH